MDIDAHHHFWKYDPAEYDWIDDGMSVIRRDFLPQDLLIEMSSAHIGGAISVQARQSLAETQWLLDLAQANSFLLAVVGWIPIIDPEVSRYLEQLVVHPKFRGVRHVLQDEPDDRYMLRDDFNAGIRTLAQFDLAYDLLVFERHLPQTIEFVDRHPGQIFILDHIAKPRIKDNILDPWRGHIRELAKRENVFCKMSGLVTESDSTQWTEKELRPYFETVLEAFTPARTMFGSDWPVCLVASSYSRWVETARSLAGNLSATEKSALFEMTARSAYKMPTH